MKIKISKSEWNGLSKKAQTNPQYYNEEAKNVIIAQIVSEVTSKVDGLFEYTIDKNKVDSFKQEFSNLMQQYLTKKQPKYFSDEQLSDIAKRRKEIYENKAK